MIVATDRDDAAVLVTLTARELDPDATIVAAAREAENVHLLKQSGADSVILSSAAAGRLLGQAVHSPQSVEVLEDLLSVGTGIDLVEREIGPSEAGVKLAALAAVEPVVAVVRGEHVLRFDDERVAELLEGDRLICLSSVKEALAEREPDVQVVVVVHERHDAPARAASGRRRADVDRPSRPRPRSGRRAPARRRSTRPGV